MSGFSGPDSVPNKGKIPKITTPIWELARAHHGDEIGMIAVTENVPVGADAELHIFPKGSSHVVDKVTGLKVLASNTVATRYKIQWKGKLPAKHGQAFVFKVVIGKLTSDDSPVLLVDVEPPVLSA